jgi:membrane associated rhomboid family serine protease
MWFTPSTLIIVLVQLIVYCVQLALDYDGAEHFWASRTYPYEVWRYVTYGFIHASLAHIVANVSMTLILAPTLEFVQGSLVVAVTWAGGVVGLVVGYERVCQGGCNGGKSECPSDVFVVLGSVR